MVTQFFALSEHPQGLTTEDRYRASITRKEPLTILDAAFISTPREVYSEPTEEEPERKLIGWEADVSTIDCALPATKANALAVFGILQEDQPQEHVDMEEAEKAYERALPEPPKPAPAPAVYSKLKIYTALTTLGKDELLENFMKKTTLPNGVNMYKAWLNAQDVTNQYPGFYDIVALVAPVVGMTVDEICLMLENCILDPNEAEA